MKNQITRFLTTKKGIDDFKAKGTILSEEEAEKYITLFISFQNRRLNYIMLAKRAILSN